MEDGENPFVRLHYAFALRDEVPVPDDGWTVWRHGPECFDEAGANLCGGAGCRQSQFCRLTVFPGTDRRFNDGMEDLNVVIDQIVGRPAKRRPRPWRSWSRRAASSPGFEALPSRRVVAVVGAPAPAGMEPAQHYEQCFELLRDCIKALRHVTQARVPNLAIERVWPLYWRLGEREDGSAVALGPVIVEHGFSGVPPVDAATVEAANNSLTAAWIGNPVETYIDFELAARNAAISDGDYAEAVLKAATAAEVLVKHTAWMITWEANARSAGDGANDADLPRLLSMKPSELIGAVLAPKLRGNWSSALEGQPVGAWREHIARLRSAVIHRGYRPSAREGNDAVAALQTLRTHVADRLAANSGTYPVSALLLVGRGPLERRGAFEEVKSAWESLDVQGEVGRYRAWLDQVLPNVTD